MEYSLRVNGVQASNIAEPINFQPVPPFGFLQAVKQVACRKNQKGDQLQQECDGLMELQYIEDNADNRHSHGNPECDHLGHTEFHYSPPGCLNK